MLWPRRLLTLFADTRVFFFTLLWLMVLLVLGTLAQKNLGLFVAQKLYFSAWILWLGQTIPTPGGAATMVLLTLSLLCKTVTDHWTWARLGTLVTHIGALTLLGGGLLTALLSAEWVMRIEEGQSKSYMVDVTAGIMPPPRTDLPFALSLEDFDMQLHPGTSMAKSYTSHVVVEDGTLRWPATISMNAPLRYKGYTFYQSSFEEMNTHDATVLAVVKNPVRLFPYLASGLMCLGLLIHLCQRLPALLRRTPA